MDTLRFVCLWRINFIIVVVILFLVTTMMTESPMLDRCTERLSVEGFVKAAVVK